MIQPGRRNVSVPDNRKQRRLLARNASEVLRLGSSWAVCQTSRFTGAAPLTPDMQQIAPLSSAPGRWLALRCWLWLLISFIGLRIVESAAKTRACVNEPVDCLLSFYQFITTGREN